MVVSNLFPVDTGRKSNVHKTFRRRPGHLLNVLRTVNLRPVFTEFYIMSKSLIHFIKYYILR